MFPWKLCVLVMLILVLYLPVPQGHISTSNGSFASQLASTSLAVGGTSTGIVGPSEPLVGETPPDRQQVETTIAVDPRNPNILVAGAQDLRLVASGEHRWHGYYRSIDGGLTWVSSLLPGFPGDTSPQGIASPLHKSNTTSDPVVAFDTMGDVFYAGLVFNTTCPSVCTSGTQSGNLAFVAKYTNDGATYSGTTLIKGPIIADKPWIAVDNTGGTYNGKVYLVFDANLTTTSPFGTLLTSSSDGGMTFSSPFYVPSDQTGELPGVAVDGSGNVYVSSDAFDPITEAFLNYIQVSKLTNGGTTLVQNVKAVNPANWLTSSPAGASFRAFTIPQIAADSSGVYLTFDDVRLGNSNVYLAQSTDGGLTWSAPQIINDVLTGQHFFPTISVSGGIINVAWYDSRLNSGTTMTSLDVYYANSPDGCMCFSPNLRVTNVSFNPEIVKRTDLGPTLQPFMGDYFGIASTPFTAYPVWADNRFACDTFDATYNSCVDQDAFIAPISLPDFSISATPSALTILQGGSRNSSVTITSLNGFNGAVTVSSSSSPPGLPINPVSKTVQPASGGTVSFNITFSPNGSTTPQTYAVTITGTSGPRTHTAAVSVTVQSQTVGGIVVTIDKAALLASLIVLAGPMIIMLGVGAGLLKTLKRWAKENRGRATSSSEPDHGRVRWQRANQKPSTG